MQSTWHPSQAAQVAQWAPPELQLRLLRLGEHLVELRARAESHVDRLLSGQDEALQQISQIRSRLLDLVSPQSVTKVERLSRLAQRLARLEQRVSKEQATCVHVLEAVLGTVERSALSVDEVFPLSSSKAPAGPTAAVAHLKGTSLQSRSSVPPPVSRAASYQSSTPLAPPATSGCPTVHAPGLQSSTLGPHLPSLTAHTVSVPPPETTMFGSTDPPPSYSTATGSHIPLVAHDSSFEPLQPSFHGKVAEHQDNASQRRTQGPDLVPNAASESQTQLVVPSEPSPTTVALQRSSPAAEPRPNPPGFTGRPGGPAEAEPLLLEAARAPLQEEVLETWVSNRCQPSESIFRAAPEPAGVTEPTTGADIIPAQGLEMPQALAAEASPHPPEETERVHSSATAISEGGALMQQEPHHEASLEVRHPPEVPTIREALHPDPQVAMAAAPEVQVCQEAPASHVVSAAPPLTEQQERSAPSSVEGAGEVPVHNEGALGPEAAAAASTSHTAAETPGGPQDAPTTSQLPGRDDSALSQALQQAGFNSHLDGPHGVDLHFGDEDALGHMLESLLVPGPEGQAGQEARPALGPHVATAGAAEEPRVPRVVQCPPSTTAPASSPIMLQWDAAGQTRHGQPPAATPSFEGRFHSTPGGPEVVRCFTSSEDSGASSESSDE